MPRYRILRTSPLTERTGEVSYEDGKAIKWHKVTTWPTLGTIEAKSEEHALKLAREQFGGRPVIEAEIHYVND